RSDPPRRRDADIAGRHRRPAAEAGAPPAPAGWPSTDDADVEQTAGPSTVPDAPTSADHRPGRDSRRAGTHAHSHSRRIPTEPDHRWDAESTVEWLAGGAAPVDPAADPPPTRSDVDSTRASGPGRRDPRADPDGTDR